MLMASLLLFALGFATGVKFFVVEYGKDKRSKIVYPK